MTEAPETGAPETEDAAPALMTPQEWARQQLAADLLRQSQAREVLRPRPEPGEQWDMEADDRRRWALQEASMNLAAERLGPDMSGEAILLPNGALAVVQRKNGSISDMKPGVYQAGVIPPEQWEEHDRMWRAHRRAGENRMLGRYYGRRTCIEGGLFTEAEADAAGIPLDPEPGTVAHRIQHSVR